MYRLLSAGPSSVSHMLDSFPPAGEAKAWSVSKITSHLHIYAKSPPFHAYMQKISSNRQYSHIYTRIMYIMLILLRNTCIIGLVVV